MNKLIAFHGKQSIKDKYISRLKTHYELDEIIKGVYWVEGKGCAVGCTLHSSEHKQYEIELGIPEVLAKLEDSIFERLENYEAKKFPIEFLEAIPIGADLSDVWNQFAVWMLGDKDYGLINLVKDKEILLKVIDLYERRETDVEKWKEAVDAANGVYYYYYAANDIDTTDAVGNASYYAANAIYAANASFASFASIQKQKFLQLLKKSPVVNI